MKAFTPGPWEKDYGGTIGHIKSISRKQDLSGRSYKQTPTVCRYDNCVGVFSEEETQANANLIAAAPELYDALEEALDELRTVEAIIADMKTQGAQMPEVVYVRGEVADQAHDILAKVRGE